MILFVQIAVINLGEDMNDTNTLIFINRSSYRIKIVKSIGLGFKMPSTIADETNLLNNHVSCELKKLKDINVVECINPEFRKGRLYRLTDKGVKLLDDVKYEPYVRFPEEDSEEDSKSSKNKSKKRKSRKKSKSSNNKSKKRKSSKKAKSSNNKSKKRKSGKKAKSSK
jgi:DNA-binding PadR family transcriptional regulator